VKKPVTVVFSALKDKPGRKMAALLKQKCDRLIITHFENSRSGDERELLVDGAEVIHDWKEAVSEALKSTEGTVVITGSLYFISLVREMFSQ
jgi:dihydrofolate synthase/folylpolyglutamate synthase